MAKNICDSEFHIMFTLGMELEFNTHLYSMTQFEKTQEGFLTWIEPVFNYSRKSKNGLYPVYYNGTFWYKRDCNQFFKDLYLEKDSLSFECGLYMGDGCYLYPDGTFKSR
jgi:hypothetical protein